MNMSWSIDCISYGEPLLWASVVVGALLGAAVGRAMFLVLRRKPTSRRTLIALPILLASPSAILLSYLTLSALYAGVRGGIACVHFVRPALVVPAVLCTALLLALRPPPVIGAGERAM